MFQLQHLPLAFTTNGKMCARLYAPTGSQAQINKWIACMEAAKAPISAGRKTLAALVVLAVAGSVVHTNFKRKH